MKTKIIKILKIFAFIVLYVVTGYLLLVSNEIYFQYRYGNQAGNFAVCGISSPYATDTTLREVSTQLDYRNNQQVSLKGTLVYNPALETFYLRDSGLIAALDVSDCQHLSSFKKDRAHVAVKGVVAKTNGQALIKVTELYTTIPVLIHMMGAAGSTLFFFLIIFPFVWGVMAIIRLIRRQPPLTREQKDGKRAGSMLVLAFIAPLVWLANPVLGAGYSLLIPVICWRGFISKKKIKAIAGLALCLIGSVAMIVISIAVGAFDKTNDFTFYTYTPSMKPTGAEHLDLIPYVNKDFYFSLHLPKGWQASEEKAAGEKAAVPVFKGPQDGQIKDTPFVPEIDVGLATAKSSGFKNLDEAAKSFVDSGAKEKNFKLISQERHWLAGGRLKIILIEATFSEDDGDKHVLMAMAEENDAFYLIGASLPAEKFDAYGQIIKESLFTLEIFPDSSATYLKLSGASLYGSKTYNGEYTLRQTQLFGTDADDLPFVECQSFDGKTLMKICQDNGIEKYPTWVFADGTKVEGSMTLEDLAKRFK